MKALISFLIEMFARVFQTRRINSRIKLSDIREGKISLKTVLELIESNVDRKELFADSIHSVAKAGLILFDFPAMNDKSAIEVAAKEIISHFFQSSSNNPLDDVRKFNEKFLNVEGLPAELRQEIEAPAQSHLNEIDDLIAYYLADPDSGPVIRRNSIPRNHKEHWMKTFYERTILKREEIVSYIATELDEVALRFSKPGYRERWYGNGVGNDLFELHDKYPYLDIVVDNYRLAYKFDMEKLDWRKVSPVRNKIFVHQFTSDYSKGYTDEINKEIMEDIDGAVILDNLISQIKKFPMIKARIEIFEELKEMFHAKYWYGFYALALPQVEGIFAEMNKLVDGNNSTSGSLTNKVKIIRPFSEGNELHFDYYEFYLPFSRNKFSHTGKDNEIELKSKYMLLDLANLLTICEDLNAPLIHLSNMISDGPEGLNHIGDLAKLVRLVDATRKISAFKDLESGLADFMYAKMPAQIDLAGYINSLQKEYDVALKAASNWIKHGFYRRKLPELDFRTMTPPQVYKHVKLIESAYNESGLFFSESFRYLLDIPDITASMLRLFPLLPQDVVDAINNFKLGNSHTLANIDKLKREAKFEDLREDFLIDKIKRMNEWELFRRP